MTAPAAGQEIDVPETARERDRQRLKGNLKRTEVLRRQLEQALGRPVRMYSADDMRTRYRTDTQGRKLGYSKDPGPWHPDWCNQRWCTAWTDDCDPLHRSDPYLYQREGDPVVPWYVFLESYEDGTQACVHLIEQDPPWRGHWWEPDRATHNILLTATEAGKIQRAMADLCHDAARVGSGCDGA